MLRIHAQGLYFAFQDAAAILQHASFTLERGFTGLVGDNGAGKSSLLRILAGELAPDAGSVRVEPDSAQVVLCAQQLDEPDAGVSMLAESNGRDARRLWGALRLDPHAAWSAQSPGERKRWQIGAALYAQPDVLLLDEPTNHLDSEGRGWLLQALARFPGIALIVSHDRALLDELTTHTLRLQDGQVESYSGGYSAARQQWTHARAALLQERERKQQALALVNQRLHAARVEQRASNAQRNAGRRMRNKHDSDSRSIFATTKAAWAEAKHGRRVEVLRREQTRAADALGSVPVDKTLGRSVFAGYAPAHAAILSFVEEGTIVQGDFTLHIPALTVHREDRIWLCGANGSGKTTLLSRLQRAWRVSLDHVMALPQELSAADSASLRAQLTGSAPDVRGRVLSVVAALGVDPQRLLASPSWSPGEARKLAIALGLGTHSQALLLDEPTNHLDLPSIERLEAALQSYPGALLLVTHDAQLGAACARTRWELQDGALHTCSV